MTIKKALLRGLIGIPIGVFISTTIVLMISLIQGELSVDLLLTAAKDPLSAFIIQYAVSIVIGFTFGLGSAIFEVDNWSLAKQTVFHLILTSVVYLPCAVLAKWVEPNFLDIFIYFLIFIIIYIVIWLIQYIIWKNKVTQLNKKLLKKD